MYGKDVLELFGEVKWGGLANIPLTASFFFHLGTQYFSKAPKIYVNICMRQQGQTPQSTLQKSLWKSIHTPIKEEKKAGHHPNHYFNKHAKWNFPACFKRPLSFTCCPDLTLVMKT